MKLEDQRVKDWMKALVKEHSIEEVASRCNVSYETILAIISGFRPMTVSGFIHLCKVFNVDPSEKIREIGEF